jgi:hypothetical protein
MLSLLQRIYWRVLAWFKSEAWLLDHVRRKAQALKDELEGELTDKFVDVLFLSMEVAFLLIGDYRRRNLRGFRGRYVLRTADNRVAASALFRWRRMKVKTFAVAQPNVTITFKDPGALRRFLLSKDQDILASLLANEVEVDGNLNYVYKLGFMARDLTRRLGFAQPA